MSQVSHDFIIARSNVIFDTTKNQDKTCVYDACDKDVARGSNVFVICDDACFYGSRCFVAALNIVQGNE